jgi:hypothetical protein
MTQSCSLEWHMKPLQKRTQFASGSALAGVRGPA